MPNSIKQKLHDLIEKTDNESLLNQIYEFLLAHTTTPVNGDLWNMLSIEQQKELFLSLEESNDATNLISNEEVKRKHITSP